jgi:hypothetical protein
VRDILGEALPRTLLLSTLALLLAYACAIPLGAWSALRDRTWRARALATALDGIQRELDDRLAGTDDPNVSKDLSECVTNRLRFCLRVNRPFPLNLRVQGLIDSAVTAVRPPEAGRDQRR